MADLVMDGVKLDGVRVHVSQNVPDDGKAMYGMDFGRIHGRKLEGAMTIAVGPLTYFRLKHGRWPFESSYTAGRREARRDRRRYGR